MICFKIQLAGIEIIAGEGCLIFLAELFHLGAPRPLAGPLGMV